MNGNTGPYGLLPFIFQICYFNGDLLGMVAIHDIDPVGSQ
jgi:hypothetical protein